MKLVTFRSDRGLKLGLVHDGRVADLAALAPEHAGRFVSARTFLEGGEDAQGAARAAVEAAVARGEASSWPALGDVALAAPIPDPHTIYALAANYREHIREAGIAVTPKEQLVPLIFFKPVTSIVGPGEAIRQPGPICTAVDYEAELGVVIGKRCQAVEVADALDYVAGYVNINDVSGRSLTVDVPREQSARNGFFDWLNGKWFDTFAPIGPYLVLKDEIPDPQALKIQLWVNGELRQSATTGDMIFSCAEAVAWISQFVTLLPGDIIATGTPSGVGATTGTYLQPGDVVEMEVEGLGRLRNPVAGPPERGGRTPRFLP